MTISEAFAHTIRELKLDDKAEKTLRNYRTACNSLLKAVPDIPIQIVVHEHINLWKENMLSQGNQTSYIARNISCLKGVLSQMEDLGLNVLEPDRIKRIKVRRTKSISAQKYLTMEEMQALVDAAGSLRDRAIIACLFSFGCRVGELLNLNRQDVIKDELTIHQEKTDKECPVFVDPLARKCLDEYLETRRDNLRPLFISGQRRRITVSRVEQILHEIADKAGIEKNVTPHVLRHTFATDLRVNGADIRDIQDRLGHASIQTTQIYTHIPTEHRREVQRKFHSKLTE